MIGLQVVGGPRFRRTARRAGEDLADLKEAHAAVGRIAANRAADLAPNRSGRLAASVRSGGSKTASTVRAGRKSVPYAGPIHWGWPARDIAAQPFISEAAQSTEAAWLPVFQAAIDQIVARIEGA